MGVNYDKYIRSTGAHYISNSGSDEKGGTRGGSAGDQTGHEWALRKWYNRPWTVALRYPDQAVALTLARLSVAAALNDRIGYDQAQRGTYWKQLRASSFDPSAIAVACEEDCTAGVSANVRAAGYLHGIEALQNVPLCTSRNMRAQFTKAGFQALTDRKYLTGGRYLLPGDVLLYERHHAAMNVTLGAAARERWNPGAAPAAAGAAFARITGGSVHVRGGPGPEYPSLGVVHAGDRLPYRGVTFGNGWLLVEYRGGDGCVSGRFAKPTE